MALSTKAMSGEVRRPDLAGTPEGYEFVRDEEGRMSLKKIRKAEKPEPKLKEVIKKKKEKK